MRLITAALLALVILFSAAAMLVAWKGGVVADETSADFNGTWKLVVLAFGEDEFAILDVIQNRGKPRAFVTSTRVRFLGQSENVTVEPLVIRDDTISFELKGPGGVNRFEGKLARDEGNAGKVLGSFTFQGEVHPARLEKTASRQVGDMKRSELVPAFLAARGVEDPKSKIEKLQEGLRKYAGNPTNYLFYTEILATAEAAGLPADEVGELIKRWRAEAEPYGPAWLGEVRLKALRALGLAKPYAEVSLQLAQETDKELGATANPDAGPPSRGCSRTRPGWQARPTLPGKPELVPLHSRVRSITSTKRKCPRSIPMRSPAARTQRLIPWFSSSCSPVRNAPRAWQWTSPLTPCSKLINRPR